MKTSMRFPLLAKVLACLSLHLLMLGLVFFLFVRWQLGLGLDSLLSGSAGERMCAFGDAVITRITPLPARQWNDAIQPLAAVKNLRATVFDPSGMIDPSMPVPANVLARARASLPPQRLDPGPPGPGPHPSAPSSDRPFRPGFEPPDDRPEPRPDEEAQPPRPEDPPEPAKFVRSSPPGPSTRPAFLMRADHGDGYWAGVMLHLPAASNPPRPPILLLIRAEHLDGSGMFFDFKPWLWGGVAVLLLSLAFWAPFVWGITRYLRRLTASADRIASGQFQVSLPPRGNDELGDLGRSIESMAARLDHLIAGQKRFLGDAAHELCAPLARIRTGLGILEMQATHAEPAALTSIESDAAELAALVEEILAFSRAGTRAPSLRTFALEPLLCELLAREAPGMAVQLSIPPGLHLKSDPFLLGRALGNLIRNAFVHAGPQAKVSILATASVGAVSITVTDDGPGVPPAELARLFEPFYRLDRSRTRDTGGSGLGLAIVRSAIESCGGSAAASLPENGGFAVTLTLPHAP
jgi:two-component system sensor histidine kinase CpxA